mmetsp:Transcript_6758/g.19453  ORF Transcript_6758/g.19453 Transcript_6758/m.19453 type:complete len:80 (+) Transcript_6758:170-409(+)
MLCTSETGCLVRRYYGGGTVLSERCVSELQAYPFEGPNGAADGSVADTLSVNNEDFTRPAGSLDATLDSYCYLAAQGKS